MKLRSLIFVLPGCLLACTAWADGTTSRMAVADMDKVFMAHPRTIAAEAEMEKGQKELQDSLQEMVAEGRAMDEQLKQLQAEARNALLSDDVRARKRIEVEEKVQEMRDFDAKLRRTQESRLRQMQEQAMRVKESIVVEMMKQVAAFADRSGYDLILDHSGLTANNIPVIVYYADHLNVTEPLIQWVKRTAGQMDEEEAE